MTTPTPPPRVLSHWERALLLLTLITSLALRLDALNVFTTIDEPTWAGRSLRFAEALAKHDDVNTYQSEHPGVLTMWLGAAAARLSDGGQAPMTLRLPTERAETPRPFPTLTWWARRGVALATWLGILALWAMLRKLIGPRAALWAAILVALDPLYLAHSRLHHLDALLTTAMTLSAVSLLLYLQRAGRGYLLLSGALAGLAIAAKSPGVFLAAWAAAVVGWAAWRGERVGRGQRLLRAVGSLALWGAAAALALVVIWPALRANPLGTLQQVLAGAERQGFNPHELGNYFWYAIRPDPGPTFYPVAWAFRASPWVLVGLAGLIAMRRRRPAAGWGWAAALFILGYAAFMTVSDKKFDRYLLPIFPLVDIAAAVGGAALVAALCRAPRSRGLETAATPHSPWEMDKAPSARPQQEAVPPLSPWERESAKGARGEGLAALFLLLTQLALILPSRPYYLAYYNPLLGGGRMAQQVLLIGWGEGLERAAAYLNAKPNAQQLHVASQSDNEFRPFFAGHTTRLGEGPAVEPDYFVLYAGQAQRRLSPEITAPLLEQTPEYTVTVNGVDYAQVYPNRFYQAETERLLSAIERQGDPDRTVALLNGAAAWLKRYGGAMPVEAVAGPVRDDYILSALQRAAHGRDHIWLLLYPGVSAEFDRRLETWLDRYATREREIVEGEVRAVSYRLIAGRSFIAARPQYETAYSLGQQARLLGYDLPQSAVTPGQPFQVRLYWQASGPTDASYKVFVHLIGPDGQLYAQQDSEPQGGGRPTTAWQPGETLVDDYALDAPANAPPGDYVLAVGMYRPDTMERLPVADAAGQRQPDDRALLRGLARE